MLRDDTHKQRQRATRLSRKALGLCRDCGEPAAEGPDGRPLGQCEKHRLAMLEQKRRSRTRHRENRVREDSADG